jgi:hypothetical protein
MPDLPTYSARDGKVFRHGVYTDQDLAVKLLAVFRQTAADPADYFARCAGEHATELEAAMLAAGYLQQPEQRAA